MTKKKVIFIATLDTKGEEAKYIKDVLEKGNLEVLIVDSGILGEATYVKPTISRCEVASLAGEKLSDLQKMDRGPAIEKMLKGVEKACLKLFEKEGISGIIAIGGGAGTMLASSALQDLPIGIPKLIVSTIACGKSIFDPFVGTKDVIVIHSVVDILGLNPVLKSIFNNAANAMIGMVNSLSPNDKWSERTVGITMYGNTTPCVMKVKSLLEKENFKVICFHANGVGGKSFENFIKERKFCGVMDITTHELTDEIVGGMHAAGPKRLEAAGETGIPQIVVPGCIEFIVEGPLSVAEKNWPGRKFYPDNPMFTLIRTSKEELKEIAETMAKKINTAKGPTALVIPVKGFSKANRPGTAIFNPEEDKYFIKELKSQISDNIPIKELEMHINNPEFAQELVQMFLSFFK
jgi:uncharacterized protein (UPF0261 family)